MLPDHPDAPAAYDYEETRSWLRSLRGPTAIDLFCGAGGLSLGLKRAGFSVVMGADSDPIAMETHAHNLGGLDWVGDLSDPTQLIESARAWGVEEVDLVAGGVPCQPFSRAGEARLRELAAAGLREQVDPRAGLWRSFLTCVKAFNPRAVLVENVPDLPRWNDGAVILGLMEGLRELGYDVDARVLRAADFGIPQHRARLFLVGLRGTGKFSWPEPHPEPVSLWEGIGDLPPIPGGHRVQRMRYLQSRQFSDYQAKMREHLKGEERWFVRDHVTRGVRDDDFEAYSYLSEGQTYEDLPPRLQRYRTDVFTDKYKRLVKEIPGRSITAHIAKDGYWYIHPVQHRTLSIREAARVQSFPDSFLFAGQPTHRFRQIGNAVPPLLGEAVGKEIFAALAGQRVAAPLGGVGSVREVLLEWRIARTPHPWRGTKTFGLWEVLLLEILLGHLEPERATGYVDQVLAIAPDPSAAESNLEQLKKIPGIGLTSSRAGTLSKAARTLRAKFDGRMPEGFMELRSIPGVGDSLAETVLCYGAQRTIPILDTASARVVGRVTGHSDGRWQLRPDIQRLAGPKGPDARFNEAVNDLARSVCLPTAPDCGRCPLNDVCRSAFTFSAQETQMQLEQVA